MGGTEGGREPGRARNRASWEPGRTPARLSGPPGTSCPLWESRHAPAAGTSKPRCRNPAHRRRGGTQRCKPEGLLISPVPARTLTQTLSQFDVPMTHPNPYRVRTLMAGRCKPGAQKPRPFSRKTVTEPPAPIAERRLWGLASPPLQEGRPACWGPGHLARPWLSSTSMLTAVSFPASC